MGEFKKEDIVFLTADSPNVLNGMLITVSVIFGW